MVSISPEAGLLGLFVSAFVSATLLPGASEALLFALVKLQPEQALPALVITTLGNVLGGMSTYAVGRLLPQRTLAKRRQCRFDDYRLVEATQSQCQ